MLRKAILAAAVWLCVFLTLTVLSPAFAGDGWYNIREQAMRLKEAHRGVDAYKTAVSFQGNGASMVDREFVAGWIALRELRRPDVALAHFTNMTAFVPTMRQEEQGSARAKAGYWIGRALNDLNRKPDAQTMFRAAAAYSTTFYGQLSSSECNVRITKDRVRNQTSFPLQDMRWHDGRIPKELVLAVIREESRFQQNAESNKKARGMMQVMDATATAVGRTAGVAIDVSMMRKSSDYNIAVGSRYLADLMQKYGNPMLAVAAYNAGPQRVDEWIGRFGDPRGGAVDPVDWVENIPFTETREYAQKVMRSYIAYIALNGKS